MKFHVRKGDTVKVLAGDDKGKQGKILFVDTKKSRATVEGVNLVSKHTKPNTKNPQGGIIKKESSIHVSNLMIVSGGVATKISRKRDEKTNKLVRYSKKSGEVIK